jgi:hypothetical protein
VPPRQRVHHRRRGSHIDRRRGAATKRTLGEHERARGALERKQERWERWALSVEVKNSPLPLLGFIDPWEPRSPNRRWRHPSLTNGSHHERNSQVHACARSLRRGNRRAAAGHHVRPPTSPTTRVAATPEKVHPQRTAVGIKWPSPLPSKRDPRAA